MTDQRLIERAKQPDLRVGRGILTAEVARPAGSYVLITQDQPHDRLEASILEGAGVTVIADALDEPALERVVEQAGAVERVVGIGGGVAMDTAKYVAWKRELPLLLAPSIISVDAAVTNTIALRRGGRVEYVGFVVATPIVADLDLIATAPPRLNRAGVGDLLSIQTGRFDWNLGVRAGDIAYDADVDAAAASVLEHLYELADDVAAVTPRALEWIIRAYADVNALLLEIGHSGPEEGSEHYFAYAMEVDTGRSFVHGELVGLGTVLMSGLQDNQQARASTFLDRCGVAWRPQQLGIERSRLVRVLCDLPGFVRAAGLPHSIIDESRLDPTSAERLVRTIPQPASIA